jgi:hypothetical protein
MLFFQLIYVFLFLIPLINTILDDDILYDIKWQPELTSVRNEEIEMKNFYLFDLSQLNWIIVMYLHRNEKRIIYVLYQHLKQPFW